jgi:hypothetical protein
VAGGLHAAPNLLAETAKLENREQLWRFKRRSEQMRHFLRDRAAFSPCTGTQPLIEAVRQILDVERRQDFLHNASLLVAELAAVKAPLRTDVRASGRRFE